MRWPLAWRSTVDRLRVEIDGLTARLDTATARLDRIDLKALQGRIDLAAASRAVSETKLLREKKRLLKAGGGA